MKIIVSPQLLEDLRKVESGETPRIENAGEWIVAKEGDFLTLELPSARPALDNPS